MENRFYSHPQAVQQEVERQERKEQFTSSLHSVRKPPTKPWKKPELPVPPKVYRVEPRRFRELVQRLTGAPVGAARRLRDAAPAPLILVPPTPAAVPAYHLQKEQQLLPVEHGGQAREGPEFTSPGGFGGLLSPSLVSAYSAWCAYQLLSPGPMTSLAQSTVP